MIMLLILFVTLSIYYLNYRRKRKAIYELCDKLPSVSEYPFIGNTHLVLGNPEEILNNIHQFCADIDTKGGVGKFWIGSYLYLVLMNVDDVQLVLETCLEKNHQSYQFLRTWLGNGLFVSPVEMWKKHKRILLPLFHKRVVDGFMDIFGEQTNILVKRLQSKVGTGYFDIFDYIGSCTLDIVFQTAMGEKMNLQMEEESAYMKARKVVLSIINLRMFKVWLKPEPLFQLTPYAKTQKEAIDLTHEFSDQIVKKKREEYKRTGVINKEGTRDILEMILEMNHNFSDENLREHIDSITIAGNDTTALVISYTLVLLGQHHAEQDRLYEELKSIFGDSERTPTKYDLNKMEYLDLVIKESMRLYPVVPIIGREVEKEIKLSNCTVPPGVGVAVVSFGIHRSKKVWGPDADLFKPERFSPENSEHRHPCAFLTFSYGSRNCIGRYYGMVVIKTILAGILRKYKIVSIPITRLKIEVLMLPVNGHVLKLEER